MHVLRDISLGANCFIHDLVYDYYGRRLVVASSDHRILVFDRVKDNSHAHTHTHAHTHAHAGVVSPSALAAPNSSGSTGTSTGSVSGVSGSGSVGASDSVWRRSGEVPRSHSGSILRLSMAHPEFGPLLASCSVDRTVVIYQENSDPKTGQSTWKALAKLVDSRQAVTDVAFAPRHLGLKLACASSDGRVRIYEANDVSNVAAWPQVEEFEGSKSNVSHSSLSISWNPSPFDPPSMAVASDNTLRIWALLSPQQKASVPANSSAAANANQFSASGSTGRWSIVCELPAHGNVIHDIAWAPNPGRTFHLVASACKDKVVRIFKITFQQTLTSSTADGMESKTNNSSEAFSSSAAAPPASSTLFVNWEQVAHLSAHDSAVWRVSWNVLGTMLASTGDDGNSRIWKSDHEGKWHHVLVAAPNVNIHSNAQPRIPASASTAANNNFLPLNQQGSTAALPTSAPGAFSFANSQSSSAASGAAVFGNAEMKQSLFSSVYQ